jgi:hypothetical protein
MKGLITTILVGAAVAGLIYYLRDKEGAEKTLGEIRDAATDAYGKMTSKLGKVQDRVSDMAGQS